MIKKEREQEILSILKKKNGFVSVRQLCESLFASESSIHRDLRALEAQGLVRRSYGGAEPENSYSNIVTFNHRTRQNVGAKREIAQKAAALIQEGNVVFLDQSSTAFYLAEQLLERSGLTVVTNNIEITMLLSNSKNRILSSGGFLSEENRNCLIGGDAQRTFENIYADVMFFSVKAVSDQGVVTDCSREEIVLRETMLKNAAKKVLLCDSSKFGGQAPFKQCTLEELDIFISEGDQARYFSSFSDKVKLL